MKQSDLCLMNKHNILAIREDCFYILTHFDIKRMLSRCFHNLSRCFHKLSRFQIESKWDSRFESNSDPRARSKPDLKPRSKSDPRSGSEPDSKRRSTPNPNRIKDPVSISSCRISRAEQYQVGKRDPDPKPNPNRIKDPVSISSCRISRAEQYQVGKRDPDPNQILKRDLNRIHIFDQNEIRDPDPTRIQSDSNHIEDPRSTPDPNGIRDPVSNVQLAMVTSKRDPDPNQILKRDPDRIYSLYPNANREPDPTRIWCGSEIQIQTRSRTWIQNISVTRIQNKFEIQIQIRSWSKPYPNRIYTRSKWDLRSRF